MLHILVASTDPTATKTIVSCLREEHRTEVVSEWADLLGAYKRRVYEYAFVDVSLIHGSGVAGSPPDHALWLGAIRAEAPSAEVVVIAPQQHAAEAVRAVEAGARAYLTYPLDPEEVRHTIRDLEFTLLLESEVDYLRDEFWLSDLVESIRTDAPVMRDVFQKVRSVAPTRSTVLLTGETGTGKGVLARLIHLHSNRRESQFIQVHCGAIPDTLIESELFGHERGAFTGAVRRKRGKFEIADGGTIFLDEIATITPAVQIKLLQVLQDRSVQRLGSEQGAGVDVRVIAATNVDLRELVSQGRFRADLYYRLNIFPIRVPPLRERREDIPRLVETFIDRLRQQYNKDIRGAHLTVYEAMRRYPWPGNVRELENLVERAFILERHDVLTPESFPRELFGNDRPSGGPDLTALPLAQARQQWIDEMEARYLKELLTRHGGRIAPSAQAAGIGPRQLHKLLTRHGIRKDVFKKKSRR